MAILAACLSACSGSGSGDAGRRDAAATASGEQASAMTAGNDQRMRAAGGGHGGHLDGGVDSKPGKGHDHEGISEDTSRGLKGRDRDGNGIRDDIDQLIAQKFSPTPEVKRAAEQKARALQAMMEASTKATVHKAVYELGRSTACIFKVIPENNAQDAKIRQAISQEIEAYTANTRERLLKYMDSNRLAGGGYFSQPPEPVCD
ncbi:hypothetical protein [Perlucidibaca piscinae]|uniref:hypothetical protein n=1 Tax=Perlucidibaca piscinae TaxID=392589 RepID=UPI0012EC24F0|nr:hypothetical protein [Perlucidibaca piscinae]